MLHILLFLITDKIPINITISKVVSRNKESFFEYSEVII